MPTWAISAASRSRFSWLFFVLPALMLNYLGQGAMILSLSPETAAETIKNPFFLLAPEQLAPAAGDPGHHGDGDRHPGGHFRRLLGHPAGDPARLHPAPAHHPHLRQRRPGRSTFPLINWALMWMVMLLVAVLPVLVQPRRGLRHRGHRRDADRHLPDGGRAVLACGNGTGRWRSALLGDLLHGRSAPISART